MDPGSKIYSPLKIQLSPIWMRQYKTFIIYSTLITFFCLSCRLIKYNETLRNYASHWVVRLKLTFDGSNTEPREVNVKMQLIGYS